MPVRVNYAGNIVGES